MYLSLVISFGIKIANGIITIAIIKLTKNKFHAFDIHSIEKFLIKVPITNAGIKIVFSSFDNTSVAFDGKIFSFART